MAKEKSYILLRDFGYYHDYEIRICGKEFYVKPHLTFQFFWHEDGRLYTNVTIDKNSRSQYYSDMDMFEFVVNLYAKVLEICRKHESGELSKDEAAEFVQKALGFELRKL